MRGTAPSPATARARELRRNATDAEKRLWALLRERLPAAKFRRQVPLGSYFADFASHGGRLIDVSRAAAVELGLIASGHGTVELELLS